MKWINESSLKWIQLSRFSRDYELRDSRGEVHAKLSFSTLFGRNAMAQLEGSQWEFRTEGLWRPRVIVTPRGGGKPEATMTMAPLGWAGKGRIEFRDGKIVDWAPRTLVHGQVYEMTDTEGQKVLGFHKPWLRQAADKNRLTGEIKCYVKHNFHDLLLLLPIYMNG
jgi:hypothetical protein